MEPFAAGNGPSAASMVARPRSSTAIGALFALGLAPSSIAHAQDAALPTGGRVAAGAATISSSLAGSDLTVSQSSDTAILDWRSFSIGKANAVHFANGAGATLNRVTGNVPSTIDGTLTATGSVFLVNPSGVIVGNDGNIATGGSFVASSLDVLNSDFLNGGDLTFKGQSKAGLVNKGVIASEQGDVALIARRVENAGEISAPNGTAALAAGYEVLMQDRSGSQGKFYVRLGGPDTEVVNTGAINAAVAEMRANGGNVYALAGNTKSVIKATGVKKSGGRIFLTGGDGGTVKVSQTFVAKRAPKAPFPMPRLERGGSVNIRGGDVTLTGTIDAAGTDGGAGGKVMAIADGTMTVGGTILAGGEGGGFIETSGGTLNVGAATLDAGDGGDWLLDPFDLTVDATAASTIGTSLNAGTNVTVKTTDTGASGPGTANASGNGDIFINSALGWSSDALLTLDAYRSIDINAPITVSGSGGLSLHYNNGGAGGSYHVNAPVNLTSSSTFSTQDGANAAINYTIITNLGAEGSTTGTDLQGINGDLTGHYVLGSNIDASATSGWNGGEGFTPLGTSPAFSGIFDGLGHTINGLTIYATTQTIPADAYMPAYTYIGMFGNSSGWIQNVGLVGGSITNGIYTSRGQQMYLGGLAAVNSGTILNSYAAVDISNIPFMNNPYSNTIYGANMIAGGLVGSNRGHIQDSHASGYIFNNPEFAGSYNISVGTGGLAGQNGLYATISNSYATTRVVSGFSGKAARAYLHAYSGGLVGINGGAISQSYATGNVYASANNDDGAPSISATEAFAGGVAGTGTDLLAWSPPFNSSITNSYATGGVEAHASGAVGYGCNGCFLGTRAAAGGLIGQLDMYATSVSNSYATGPVSATSNQYLDLGGLVGISNTGRTRVYGYGESGTIINSYYSESTGQSDTGKGVRKTASEMQDPFTFIDAGWDFANVWGKSTTGENNGNMMLRGVGPGTLYDAYVKAGSDTTKTYGDANPSLSGIAQVYGNGTVDWGSAITTATNVGTYAYSDPNVLNISTPSANGAYLSAGSYGLTINPAALTVTANDLTKTYDGLAFNGNGVSYSGFVNGETSSVLGGTLAYGGNAAGAINAGNYTITPSGYTSGNYVINYVDGALTVNKAALTVTANNDSKTYDRAAYSGGNGVSYSGFVNGETSSVLGGSVSYGGTAQGAVNAGSYAITPFGLSSGNYDISYVDGSLSVNKAPLTINAANASKTYGDLASLTGYSIGGLIAGDSVNSVVLESGGVVPTANAGTYAITARNAVGSGLENYAIAYNEGALRVDPAHISVAALGGSSTYGAHPANPGLSATGLKNGQTVGVLEGLANSFGISNTTDAGHHTLSVNGTLTNANYMVDTRTDGTWTVDPRQITVSANSATTYLDTPLPVLTATVTNGSLAPQDLSLSRALSGFLVTTNARKGSPLGEYVITASGTNPNYLPVFTEGTLTILDYPHQKPETHGPGAGKLQARDDRGTGIACGSGAGGLRSVPFADCWPGIASNDCAVPPNPAPQSFSAWLKACRS